MTHLSLNDHVFSRKEKKTLNALLLTLTLPINIWKAVSVYSLLSPTPKRKILNIGFLLFFLPHNLQLPLGEGLQREQSNKDKTKISITGLMTSRENYSLRGNVSCAFSSAHSPDKVANKKHTLLFEKQKMQGMRGGRVGSSEVMKATKSGKLMAQQTPLQSAFLGRKLRKCCPPPPPCAPPQSSPLARQGSALHAPGTSGLVPRASTFYFSVLSLTSAVPFTPNKKEEPGFLSKHRAVVLNLGSLVGIQGVHGLFEIIGKILCLHIYCAFLWWKHPWFHHKLNGLLTWKMH